MHGDRFMSFVTLLKLKSDGDCICECKGGVVMRNAFSFLVEAKVAKAQYSGATFFFWNIGAKIFARAHGKKDCADD